ncbi:hypothetical protein OE88DRAFT_1643939 [Heliocybe sulcata]|uniref:Uncharacterized protein n=1 Tax=Heliocybe sulcata TaxID=5364 RepID=A0A5C3N3I9_9AGAM|nr:hypothetical protein OE88DRAFT_1643939 [Heliocybe sulcata]
MASPHDLFAATAATRDTWTFDGNMIAASQITPTLARQVTEIMTGRDGRKLPITITCTTTAAQASYQDYQDANKANSVFLVGFHLSFNSYSPKEEMHESLLHFAICARVLKDCHNSEGPSKDGDGKSEVKDLGDGLDAKVNAEKYEPCFSKDVPEHPNAFWVSTSPQSAGDATSVTTSNSYNLGLNVGFFGSTPTGGIDGGFTISNSKTTSVAQVKIQNMSTPKCLDIRFKHQTEVGCKSTFQPYVEGIFQLEDDKQGDRSDTAGVPGREVSVELTLCVLPGEFVELAEQQRKRWERVPQFRRVFQLRLPPLPVSFQVRKEELAKQKE